MRRSLAYGGTLGRRALLGTFAAGAWIGPWVGRSRAQTGDARQPIGTLYAGLQTVMRMGPSAPFQQRFDRLAPVIDQVFDLDTILRSSVGLRWSALDEAARQTLSAVFRGFTIASYTANFDSDSGEKFEVLPQTRAVAGDTVVESRLLPAHGDPVRIDYVMRGEPMGWRAVDVLLDGTISRVAVQRSDFRSLLAGGNPAPLIASLRNKVARLEAGDTG